MKWILILGIEETGLEDDDSAFTLISEEEAKEEKIDDESYF